MTRRSRFIALLATAALPVAFVATPRAGADGGGEGGGSGSGDSVAPQIESIAWSANPVDVTGGDQQVTLTLREVDDLSGFSGRGPELRLLGTGAPERLRPVATDTVAATTGERFVAATFTYTFTVPGPFPRATSWSLKPFTIGDAAGNKRSIGGDGATAQTFASLSFNPVLGITGLVDTDAPHVASMSLSANTVDVSAGSQSVTLTVRITDDVAGVDARGPVLSWSGEKAPRERRGTLRDGAVLNAQGKLLDGTFDFVVTVPGPSIASTEWKLAPFKLTDVAGNKRTIGGDGETSQTFTSLSFDPVLHIISATVKVASKGATGGNLFLSVDQGSLVDVTTTETVSPPLPTGQVDLIGRLAFTVTGLPEGGTAVVTIKLPDSARPTGLWKLDGDTFTDRTDLATFNKNTVTLTLVDGGAGDQDGTVNGIIVDPLHLVRLAPTPVVKLTLKEKATVGSPVVLVARLTELGEGRSKVGGTVDFLEGDTVRCAAVPVTESQARCVVPALEAGEHTFTAVYSGSPKAMPATSQPFTFPVRPAATRTSLKVSRESNQPGVDITFTAKVALTRRSSLGAPTGTVTFTDGDTVLCADVALVDGTAVCVVQLAEGSHRVVATFNPTSAFAASSSEGRRVKVKASSPD